MWSSYSSPTTSSQPSLFLLNYKTKRLIVTRPTSYDTCHASIRQHFPEIPLNHKITFHTKDLDVCDGQLAQISTESWNVIIPLINSITIQTEAPSPPQVLDGRVDGGRSNRRGLGNGDINEPGFLSGRKPVIYLSSPSEVMAAVTLSLVRQWKFSAIYPVVPIKRLENEELEWKVRVRPNGELTETNTGLDVAYLFWEAQTNSSVPVSPPHSPIMGRSSNTEVFNPNDARLCDDDSVVISVDTVTPYLDAVLKELGLHTEARTSFITYWLPDMLKHKHVALRFLPQTAYERAAPLKITPAPDITTRVFMLFTGVDEELLLDWPQARERAGYSAEFWKDVVGVDCKRSLDESLFRVLEWGGMEVK